MLLSTYPHEIVQNVLTHFLHLKEIVLLDIAVINRYERDYLLSVYKKTILWNEICVTDSICSWLKRRLIMPRSAKFTKVVEEFSLVVSKANKLSFTCQIEVNPDDLLRILVNAKHLDFLILQLPSKITDDHVASLTENCSHLVTLSFVNFSLLTDESIQKVVENCRYLRCLNVTRCVGLTDKSIILLAERCPLLTGLKFSFCRNISDTSILSLAQHCRPLQTLHMGYVDKITHEAVVQLWDALPGLMSVDLTFCTALREDTLAQLARKCRGLESLYLDMYPVLTDNTLNVLSEHCVRLKHAYFGKARISDSSMGTLLQRCHHLSHIDLNCCSLLTDATLLTIGQYCSGLVRLNVMGCTRMRLAGSIVEIARCCPVLEVLVLDMLQEAVSDEVLAALAEHCPRLSFLSLVWCLAVTPAAMDTMRAHFGKQLRIRAPGEVDFVLYIS